MAKPLGPKSALIREAIQANPGVGNGELAEKINSSEAAREAEIEVTSADVAQQRQRLKTVGGGKKGKGKAAPKKAARAAGNGRTSAPPAPARQAGLVELLDRVFSLAQECGGLPELKRLVDRLAQAQAP
jgi:hypothetical protein